MTPNLTEDMREALSRKTGGPIEVRDDQTQKVYVLVDRDAFGKLVNNTLRQSLQIGLDQSDRGESEPWDVEHFFQQAHSHSSQAGA